VLVTFAEFALIKGCSKPAVSHAVKSGRIAGAVVEKDEKRWLDRDLALELWNRNTLKTHNAKVSRPDPVEVKPAKTAKELQARVEQLPDDAIPELNVSRERREHYQAELSKLEVDAKRGELVSAEAVKKEAFNLAKTVREALVNIPDRLANQLAAESDPATIHMALSQELVLALERLANA
jgi:phage terminase Nu1 subunit (DNA packaging protein)